MKTTTLLFALSTLVFSSTAAQVHPHIHRRCAPNNSSVSGAPLAPAPTTLVTSVATSASASPPAGSASPPAASASPLAASSPPPPASASASLPPPASSATGSPPSLPSPSTAPSTGAGTAKQVTIAAGDTLEKIAASNGVGMCDLVKANNIQDPNLILTGETLSIPVLTGEKDDKSCLV